MYVGRGASGAWRQRRLATAARGACGAWRAGGAWRLRRLATVVLGAIFCLGWHRDLQRPPKAPRQCFRDVARVISSRYITSGHAGRFQPAPMCYTQLLFLPLSVWFGLSRPLEASRGPDEPQITVFRCRQSDVIGRYYFWARWMLPTCSDMLHTTFIPVIVGLMRTPEDSRGLQYAIHNF